MAGSGVGTGVFSYWFRARFYLWPEDDVSNDLLVGSISVEGSADRRFALWGHRSPRYQQVSIDWSLTHAQQSGEGQVVANLREMQLYHKNEVRTLDLNSLSTLFGVGGEPESKAVAELYAFLECARDGLLPLPSHHGHSFSDPLPGRMQHFASGPSIRPFELAWVIAWCGFGAIALIRRSPKKVSSTVDEDA